MLSSCEVERDPVRGGGDRQDIAGEHTGTIVGWFARQAQNPHARVVVVQNFALRCLPDQFIACRFHDFGGFFDYFPLRRSRKRNAHEFFHLLQPIEGNSAAVFHLGYHRSGCLVVLLRAHAFRFLRSKNLPTGVAAQPFQFIDRSCERSLTHDPHQQPRLFLFVDIAASAVRATIAGLQIRVRDLYFFGATKRVRAIASMARRFVLAHLGLCFVRRRSTVLIPEYRTRLLRVSSPHQSFRHRMQCGLQSLTVRLVQWFTHGAVDDPVQLIHIHIDPPA